MECYRSLADVYDNLINSDIDYKLWASVIKEKAKKYNVNFENYLDVACGTGNFTKHLCSSFKSTWAVDLSDEMLTVAEEKFREEGLKAKFICQDMRELCINRKFDLITCCLDSTNYLLEDNEVVEFFKSVQSLINDDGIFLFDINSYYKLTEILGNELYSYDDEEIFYLWQNFLEDNVVDMELTFFIKDGQVYNRFDETHRERAYTEDEIEKFLRLSGFQVLEKLNNYTETIIEENSERITYIVKKLL
ncbi:MAG: class I SAM-dependent methyltransferase [Clostridium sp.]